MGDYGYARVSSKGQNETRQVVALLDAGVPMQRIFVEKRSGKDFERTVYEKMVKRLKEGDVLFVKSIDRLGRNYEEIGNQWRLLTKEMGVDIVILDMPLLDTRVKVNGLIGTFIADIVLQIFSYVAQVERENILQRQREGIDAALQKGAKYGRPLMEVPPEFEAAYEARQKGEISFETGGQILGVSRSTFRRWCLKADKDGSSFREPGK